MRFTVWCILLAALGLTPTSAQFPTFPCQYTEETITADGRLDEPVWQTLETIPLIVPVTFAAPVEPTVGRICWNRETLFVALCASDEDLYATQMWNDSAVFRDDALEVFLQPGPIDWGYHNIEINALGYVLDQHGMSGGGTGWTCEGMEIGIDLRGTVNDSSDTDAGWCLEVAIPFASLIPAQEIRPQAGDEWRFHLARLNYPSRNPEERELSSCARLPVPFYHDWPNWAMMRFGE